MKAIKIAIISILIGTGFTSCDFLDKEPTALTPETFYANESDAYSALTGVYSILLQSPFYGSDYLYLIGGDDLGHYGGAGRSPRVGGLICNNANSGDPQVATLWFCLYSGIDRANLFLENVDRTPGMSNDAKTQYKAEARFLRAYYYFTLVSGWGDVPFKTSSTQSVEGLSIPRTSKEMIYDFIATEMNEATDYLKSAADLGYKPGRISKSTAWGILARVYMFRAGECYRDHKQADETKRKAYFGEASKYAQMVMGQGHGLAPNYWDVFIDLCSDQYNSTANESIWEVEFAGNRTTDTRTEGRIGNIIGIPGPDLSSTTLKGKENPGYGYGFIYTTPKLLDLYEENGDTERCDWNIAPFTYQQATTGSKPVNGRLFEFGKKGTLQYPSYEYGSGDTEKTLAQSTTNRARVTGKFRREYEKSDPKAKNDTPINFPILRYSDVLLMIAEAENEINAAPNELAYKCINDVRERAGIAKLENLSKELFREALKNERAMELCFEYTRRFDLIRWGEYVKKMNELAPIAQAGTGWTQGPTNVYTYFKISDAYNYFPIPASEMAVNKAITENNPGW